MHNRKLIATVGLLALLGGSTYNSSALEEESSAPEIIKEQYRRYANERIDIETNILNSSNYLQTASPLSSSYSTTYVYTPNGTAVEVSIYEEFTDAEIEKHNSDGDFAFPDATRIADSSQVYNCHSYAWYMQSTSNPYWMSDPSSYYTDGSYKESTGNIGDIICYYTENGIIVHSGVVIGILQEKSWAECVNSDLVTLRSKWGAFGLYEHAGNYCPYVIDRNGTATYVKFYTLQTHSYTYTWISYTKHHYTCTCGETGTQVHAVSSDAYSSGNMYATCLLCGGDALIGITQLSVDASEITQVTDNGSFILPNGVIVLVDEDVGAYIDGTLEFHEKTASIAS